MIDEHSCKYLVGIQFLEWEHYPFGVSYCPYNPEAPIELWEGYFKESAGGNHSLKEALEPRRRFFFTNAKAEWFIPCIERMARGETISLEEIDAKHKELTGMSMKCVSPGETFWLTDEEKARYARLSDKRWDWVKPSVWQKWLSREVENVSQSG